MQQNLTSSLPPPPIFKPTFIQMNKSNSTSKLETKIPSTSTSISTSISTPSFSSVSLSTSTDLADERSKNVPTKANSNFLTSSFVSNEDYKDNFLNHSPSISPMTKFNEMPSPNNDKIQFLNSNNNNMNKKSRKRRRSSTNSKEDIERKKKELKTQHSIIEKRRRVKMNREFEALKFLVPACRLNILTGLNESNENFENSNMMHKLTILQSTVEYIKYLHLIIKLMKLQMLIPKKTRKTFKSWFQKNDFLKFVDFDLDLQSYRDIESEFNFENLFLKVWQNDGNVPKDWLDPITLEISKFLSNSEGQTGDDEKEEKEEEEKEEGGEFRVGERQNSLFMKIQTPSSILNGNIENQNILQSPSEDCGFKLPPPALPTGLPILSSLQSSNVSTQLPPLNYILKNSSTTTAISSSTKKTKTYNINNNEHEHENQDEHRLMTQEVHTASKLLMEIKSNKRRISIENMLN